jgi:hypothetical protein
MADDTAKRLDSRLENVGAEFLVLGHLLFEGIEAHKAYTNYPGCDIVAVDPETRRQCRIQVKSRWATDYNRTFPIKNFDCDFVVVAALNRGFATAAAGRQPTKAAGHRSSSSSPSMSSRPPGSRRASGRSSPSPGSPSWTAIGTLGG